MTLSRNPLFEGRVADLRLVARSLRDGATTVIAAATGIGGIGKTQLACEFAHRYGGYFGGGVFWLSFANPAAVPTEIAACGGMSGMNLPGLADLSLDEQIQQVRQAWQQPIPRLLIFDNCEDEALLDAWRPTTGGSRVLVTSRRQTWDLALGVQAHHLETLARQESVALLRRFRPDVASADPLLSAIADELGDLPLALHLAGSYLHRYQQAISPAAYLAQLRDARLLGHRSLTLEARTPTGHEAHVARTFALSYEQLQPARPIDALALALLARVAYFAPGEPIPHDLLIATAPPTMEDLLESSSFRGLAPLQALQVFGRAIQSIRKRCIAYITSVLHPPQQPDDTTADSVLHAEDGLARLRSLGLIEASSTTSVKMHRLIAGFTRDTAQDPTAHASVEEAIRQASFDLQSNYSLDALARVQVHLRFVTDSALPRQDKLAIALCSELGLVFSAAGEHNLARDYLTRALAMSEHAYGSDHENTAAALGNLAGAYWDTGDLPQAQQALERAIQIDQRIFGADHPSVANDLNMLGVVLGDSGAYDEARPLLERALAINEQALGPTHPDTALSLNNLAMLLYAQGDYTAVRPLFEHALAINEQALGPAHPTTATILNNLAMLLNAQGDYTAARLLYERALAACEQALGPTHPDTARSLNNLGYLLQAQGDLAGARPYYERALAICEVRLGADHPTTRTIRANLAALDAPPPSAVQL